MKAELKKEEYFALVQKEKENNLEQYYLTNENTHNWYHNDWKHTEGKKDKILSALKENPNLKMLLENKMEYYKNQIKDDEKDFKDKQMSLKKKLERRKIFEININNMKRMLEDLKKEWQTLDIKVDLSK